MNRDGYVYVFRCGPYYKIGATERNVNQRLSAVQTGNPLEVELVHVMSTNRLYSAEKFFHLKFESKRVRNEWFELDERDVEWIKKVNTISDRFLQRYDLSVSKQPGKAVAVWRSCSVCSEMFVLDMQKSPKRIYCSPKCQQRATVARTVKKHVDKGTDIPKSLLHRHMHDTWKNCVVCGATLPKGFGPCCSRECVFAYRESLDTNVHRP